MRALDKVKIEDVLFFDIETSSTVKRLDINSLLFDSWAYKNRRNGETDEELVDMYEDKAALFADFGRIVCISVGMVGKDGFKTTTFNDFDEKVMIEKFYAMLDKLKANVKVCGHAVKSFDIPYVAQRGMINNLRAHDLMDTGGLKPWELDWILDTKDLWSGTSFNKSSLINVTTVLGIPSPKDGITGKDVPAYFWADPKGNIQEISDYCERDVEATYEVLKFMKNVGLKPEVESVPEAPKTLLERLFDGAPYGAPEKDELFRTLEAMSEEERTKTFVVLDATTSAAKGKKTKMTKTHVKALKALF